MAKSLIGRIVGKLKRASRSSPANVGPGEGSIFSFHTSPFSEYSPKDTGRYAAFKILGSDAGTVTIAVLEGIWTTPPTYSEASTSAILKKRRLDPSAEPAVFGTHVQDLNMEVLKQVTLLGVTTLSTNETKIARQIENFEPGTSYAALDYANILAEGEWRWINDREAISAEVEKLKAKYEVEHLAREQRYKSRLQHLTWDQLLAETPFLRWSPSPPFPPEEFVTAAREVVHTACRELQAHGRKPRKSDVRAVLKRCVVWFNEADARFGGVIETEEREDICEVLEEMAVVAGQRSIVDEIDTWRDW